MAITVKEDVVSGMTYSVNQTGASLTRKFGVGGLPSQANTLWLATRARDAVTGVTIPQVFQAHPSIPGLFVQNVQADPWAGDSRINAKVTVTYGWLSLGANSIQVKLTGTRTVLHANKDPISGEFFQVPYDHLGLVAGPNGTQVPGLLTAKAQLTFDIYSNNMVMEITRIETGSPKLKAANYVGTVNSEPAWQGVGSAARLWMCNSIEGTQVGGTAGGNGGGGQTFSVTYVFEYNPFGWYQLGLYQDSVTKIVPPDILNTNVPVAGPAASGLVSNGVTAYVPRVQSFSALGIPNV